jgi:hypothetical protein
MLQKTTPSLGPTHSFRAILASSHSGWVLLQSPSLKRDDTNKPHKIKQWLYGFKQNSPPVEGIMTADKEVERVLVDPARAVRCGWCGSFESDKWRSDVFRSSLWCSSSCYYAAHFGESVCLTLAVFVVGVIFIPIVITAPGGFYLSAFIILLTVIMALLSMNAYSARTRTPKAQR